METLAERIHLEDNEQILCTVRKHWFILVASILGPTIGFLVPIAAYFLLVGYAPAEEQLRSFPDVGVLALFAISTWGLLMWITIFTMWTDFYLDQWTITDRRIIAIDQRGLFSRSIASFRYERLQDVTVEINGLIATFFNFGDIHAQTAGNDIDFKINGIPDPREQKAIILRAADTLLEARHASIHAKRLADEPEGV